MAPERQSERDFQRLLAHTPATIWACGTDGGCTFVNQHGLDFVGITLEEALGAGWADYAHPEDRPRVDAQYLAAFEARRPFELEYRLRRHDGEYRDMVAHGVPTYDEWGAFTGYVGSSTDVTALRLAERERSHYESRVRESQRLESLGVLAGGIAHDFNNLLTVILGNSRLALEDLDPASPLRARIERVRGAAQQAARLTEQMLTYAGKGSVALEPLDLSRVVRDMERLLESCLEGRGVLELSLPGDLPAVEADPGQMRQVVLNLVINAAESMQSCEGAVRVRTGSVRADAADLAESYGFPDLAPGEYVFLEVADSGQGVEPGQRERLFEPFFSTKSEGRGLGLAVVLGIVRGHRGAIQVASAPAEGTTFRVLLPPSPRAARPDGPELEPASGERRVLVVDDDDGVREVAEAYLERAGFAVVGANGGRKAIELLSARPEAFAAAVLDLAMPELDGSATWDELRRIKPDLPILLVSGFSEEQAEERFPELDSGGLLRKPYEPEALIERVRALLDPG